MAQDSPQLEQPMVHLVHMAVFTLVVAVLGAVLYSGIKAAFMANPFLNGLIIATLSCSAWSMPTAWSGASCRK
jgi:hypothetical protein